MVEPGHAVHAIAVHANAVHTNAAYATAAQRQEALASQLRQRNDHAHHSAGLAAQAQSPLQRLQALADASPQVAQLKRLQALADAASRGALQRKSLLQRKNPEEEELLKGRSRAAQRKAPKDDELLQGQVASSQGTPRQLQASPSAATATPNRTGMPEGLKSGIESLSGLSMEHVRVHYNSSKPAQLNAHAQGSDIHLAPGQDQHLPHEAWHLVQQAQGRVRPTLQLNGGVAVNDDPGLEREADLMGAKALATPIQLQGALPATQSNAVSGSPHQVVQMTSYMRSLNRDDKIGGEIESLRRVFLDETKRDHTVNTWVDGFAGMPTARFTTAECHYYSPVGYKLEINNDEDVLANYQGDGNTNDIPVTHPRWVTAAQNLRGAVMQVLDYTRWAADLEDDPYTSLPPVDEETGIGLKRDYINYYLKPYLQSTDPVDPDSLQARNDGKTAVREAIKNSGIAMLREHYADPTSGLADRHIGTGRNPNGMAEAIGNRDIAYIESILHAKSNQVTAAWYNKDPGNYPEATAQANWRAPAPGWLENRRGSAEAIRNEFNNVGVNIQVEQIGPEPQGT